MSQENGFDKLREANVERLPLFKTAKGKPAHSQPDGSDWSLAEWTNAIAGEAGEACNIAKKIIRGEYDGDRDGMQLAKMALAKELADVIIYCDLAMYQLRMDTWEQVRLKFNEVSRRVGADVFLVPQSRPPAPTPTDEGGAE